MPRLGQGCVPTSANLARHLCPTETQQTEAQGVQSLAGPGRSASQLEAPPPAHALPRLLIGPAGAGSGWLRRSHEGAATSRVLFFWDPRVVRPLVRALTVCSSCRLQQGLSVWSCLPRSCGWAAGAHPRAFPPLVVAVNEANQLGTGPCGARLETP